MFHTKVCEKAKYYAITSKRPKNNPQLLKKFLSVLGLKKQGFSNSGCMHFAELLADIKR